MGRLFINQISELSETHASHVYLILYLARHQQISHALGDIMRKSVKWQVLRNREKSSQNRGMNTPFCLKKFDSFFFYASGLALL